MIYWRVFEEKEETYFIGAKERQSSIVTTLLDYFSIAHTRINTRLFDRGNEEMNFLAIKKKKTKRYEVYFYVVTDFCLLANL